MDVSESKAVEIAKRACAARGIPWREPYRAKKGWLRWTVFTPSEVRGGNAVIYISKKDGRAKVRHYER